MQKRLRFVPLMVLLAAITNPSGASGGQLVFSLAVAPHAPDQMFAAVNGHGVFRTDDGGRNWIRCSTGLPKDGVRNVWVDPMAHGVVLAGSEFWGVYRSEDFGTTWRKLSICALAKFPAICMLVGNPQAILAGGGGCGVLRSDDHGISWTRQFATTRGGPNTGAVAGLDCGVVVSSIKVENPRKSTVLVGTVGSDVFCSPRLEPGLYRADPTSGELSKLSLNGGAVSDVDTEPSSPATILVAIDWLARSTDQGKTWDYVLQEHDVTSVRFAPLVPGLALAAKSYGGNWFRVLFRSTDHGASWKVVNTLFNGVNVLVFHPRLKMVVFAATDRGVFRSEDGGATWREIGSGLP